MTILNAIGQQALDAFRLLQCNFRIFPLLVDLFLLETLSTITVKREKSF